MDCSAFGRIEIQDATITNRTSPPLRGTGLARVMRKTLGLLTPLFMIGFVIPEAAAETFRIRDLGTLRGSNSDARAVSNSIAGSTLAGKVPIPEHGRAGAVNNPGTRDSVENSVGGSVGSPRLEDNAEDDDSPTPTLTAPPTQTPTANLVVDGNSRSQLMEGSGINVYPKDFFVEAGGVGASMYDAWASCGQGGGCASLFRIPYEPTDWSCPNGCDAAARPSTTLAAMHDATNPANLATLQSVYETTSMQNLWATLHELNAQAISGLQLQVNFMGWTAQWMGGTGHYTGGSSTITNNAQTNQDFADMLASLVYYGKVLHSPPVSFSQIERFNEMDASNGSREGPLLSAAQTATIATDLINDLNAFATADPTHASLMNEMRIAIPSTCCGSGEPTSYSDVQHNTAGIPARVFAWTYHDYNSTVPGLPTGSYGPWSITETMDTQNGGFCDVCDTGCGGQSTCPSGCDHDANQPWTWGSRTVDRMMDQISNGYTGTAFWLGTEGLEVHHGLTGNQHSCWPTVHLLMPGRTFTYDRGFYAAGPFNHGPRPGRYKVSVTGSGGGSYTRSPQAFYNPTQGGFGIIGHTSGAVSIAGRLDNLPAVSSLTLTHAHQDRRGDEQRGAVGGRGERREVLRAGQYRR